MVKGRCVSYLGLELNGMVHHSGSFDAHDINHHRQVRVRCAVVCAVVCAVACAVVCAVVWGGRARAVYLARALLSRLRVRGPNPNPSQADKGVAVGTLHGHSSPVSSMHATMPSSFIHEMLLG